MIFRRYVLVLALVPALLLPVLAQAGALYTIHFLPENFYPADINNAGQIAGTADFGDNNAHAAMYAGGVITDLGSFGNNDVNVVAITEAGAVLGNAGSSAGDYRAFVRGNGNLRDVAGLYGYGINAGGDIVGYNNTRGAVLYSQGRLTELGYLGSGDFSVARGINDAGAIVGTSTIDLDFRSRQHPFLYRDGVLHDLGTLDEREFNSAVAINSAGQIAGYSEGKDGGMHAFFYENGVMTDLGSFGGLNLDVGGMNEHGQLVGSADPWEGDRIGFISQGGGLVDLNTLIDPALGWQIGGAIAINDNGQILAYACRDFQCTNVRLDLASAVPEPEAAGMFLFGLLALAAVRRRRKKAAGPCGYGGFFSLQR
jgi:probable HAF family extracellular repeat protein